MSIVDWIYPRICVGCGREGHYICGECEKQLLIPSEICPMCGRLSLGGWTHAGCKRKGGMERLIVGLPYTGLAQTALKKVKYKNAWDVLSDMFGVWVRKVDGNTSFPKGAVVTSVPMYPKKERERGFNQAEVFAQKIADYYGLKSQLLLKRVRETKPMYGLIKKERKENVLNAFELVRKRVGKQIILVDDVWTTGSTMRECARKVKEGGAREIWGLAMAR